MLFQFLVRALVLFTAMPVHECAHGLAATRLGDDTPRLQGRLTLNPLAHLDWTGSILLFFTGFGWAKPVQVDMRGFKHPRRDMALVSVAGPLSNLLMSFAMMTVYRLLPASLSNLAEILYITAHINLSLAVFNLLPLPPLDGSKILGVILPQKLYYGMLRHQRAISAVMILLLYFGVLSIPVWWLTDKAFYYMKYITAPLALLWKS